MESSGKRLIEQPADHFLHVAGQGRARGGMHAVSCYRVIGRCTGLDNVERTPHVPARQLEQRTHPAFINIDPEHLPTRPIRVCDASAHTHTHTHDTQSQPYTYTHRTHMVDDLAELFIPLNRHVHARAREGRGGRRQGAPLCGDDGAETAADLLRLERGEAEARAPRLQGRDNLAHIVANEAKARVLGVLFDNWSRQSSAQTRTHAHTLAYAHAHALTLSSPNGDVRVCVRASMCVCMGARASMCGRTGKRHVLRRRAAWAGPVMASASSRMISLYPELPRARARACLSAPASICVRFRLHERASAAAA
jgi:hypothetical protein